MAKMKTSRATGGKFPAQAQNPARLDRFRGGGGSASSGRGAKVASRSGESGSRAKAKAGTAKRASKPARAVAAQVFSGRRRGTQPRGRR
ncbi:MAG TPA: hypothetical protein PK916_04750 [Bacteroidota bacterium]|nr:hypothetical protein [Bacteroidota bacterium]